MITWKELIFTPIFNLFLKAMLILIKSSSLWLYSSCTLIGVQGGGMLGGHFPLPLDSKMCVYVCLFGVLVTFLVFLGPLGGISPLKKLKNSPHPPPPEKTCLRSTLYSLVTIHNSSFQNLTSARSFRSRKNWIEDYKDFCFKPPSKTSNDNTVVSTILFLILFVLFSYCGYC